jgi:hypothetical protein
MPIEEQENTEVEQPAVDDASINDQAKPPETDGSIPDGGDEPTLDEKAEAAFKAGIKELTEPKTEVKKDDAEAPKVDAAKPADGAGAPAKDAKPATEEKAKPEPDAALDAEIKGLGLKGKAEARFRELTSSLKEQAPLVEAYKALKIETPAQLNQIVADAKQGMEFQQAIEQTKASPEQFGQAFTVIGAMNSGNPELMERAVRLMHEQANTMAKQLGIDLGANVDPLDAHADLKQAVETMEITREYALQIAKQRGTEVVSKQTQAQQTQAAQQEAEMTKTQTRAMEDVKEWCAEVEKTDPHAQHKLQVLASSIIPTIRATVPPSRWATEIAKAYARIPNPAAQAPAAPPAKPRPSHVPMRSGAPSAGLKQQPKNDFEAFRMGVADVSPHLQE